MIKLGGTDMVDMAGDAQVISFRNILEEANWVSVERESRGRDISAACDQLKAETNQCRRSL